MSGTHSQVNCSVEAQRCLFGRERLSGPHDVIGVTSASICLADKLCCSLAAKSSVIGPANRQEMRSQTSCNELTSVDEDVRRKQTKYINTYRDTTDGLRIQNPALFNFQYLNCIHFDHLTDNFKDNYKDYRGTGRCVAPLGSHSSSHPS